MSLAASRRHAKHVIMTGPLGWVNFPYVLKAARSRAARAAVTSRRLPLALGAAG
ncbi:hypothetical protein Mame01_07060 [Microbispora amethystogenes]|nr:hypothetical protein Mame01_07060 [Microbispora amethystogenes]